MQVACKFREKFSGLERTRKIFSSSVRSFYFAKLFDMQDGDVLDKDLHFSPTGHIKAQTKSALCVFFFKKKPKRVLILL